MELLLQVPKLIAPAAGSLGPVKVGLEGVVQGRAHGGPGEKGGKVEGSMGCDDCGGFWPSQVFKPRGVSNTMAGSEPYWWSPSRSSAWKAEKERWVGSSISKIVNSGTLSGG